LITIGERSYTTHKPKDLDAALLESTGCNAAETAAAMAGNPNPGRLASALRPFLPDDAPSLPDLAAEIATSGDGVLAKVRKLYSGEAEEAQDDPE
jgi:hypothetical protein